MEEEECNIVLEVCNSPPQHVATNLNSKTFLFRERLTQIVASPDLFISSLDNTFGMKNLIGVSLALLIGFSHAACPNQCSGHGTCGVDEVVSETLLNRMVLLSILSIAFPAHHSFSVLSPNQLTPKPVHLLSRMGNWWRCWR